MWRFQLPYGILALSAAILIGDAKGTFAQPLPDSYAATFAETGFQVRVGGFYHSCDEPSPHYYCDFREEDTRGSETGVLTIGSYPYAADAQYAPKAFSTSVDSVAAIVPTSSLPLVEGYKGLAFLELKVEAYSEYTDLVCLELLQDSPFHAFVAQMGGVPPRVRFPVEARLNGMVSGSLTVGGQATAYAEVAVDTDFGDAAFSRSVGGRPNHGEESFSEREFLHVDGPLVTFAGSDAIQFRVRSTSSAWVYGFVEGSNEFPIDIQAPRPLGDASAYTDVHFDTAEFYWGNNTPTYPDDDVVRSASELGLSVRLNHCTDLFGPNFARLTTGSPVILRQTVDTPDYAFNLVFDYRFESLVGNLEVLLNDTLIGTIASQPLLQESFQRAKFLIDGTLLNKKAVDLTFRFDGPEGSTIALDNVVFPHLTNAGFEAGSLSGWTAQHSGNGSANVIVRVAGDYNSSGTVDAADYVVWRKAISPEPTKSTLVHWRFENGSDGSAATGDGSILDSEGAQHGTPIGGPIYRNDVPINLIPQTGATNSLSLQLVNGASDSISIPDPTGILNPTDEFTVEFWMKADQNQPESLSVLVDHSHGFTDATGWAMQAARSTGHLLFAVGNAGTFTEIDSGQIVLDGVWHHVAGTFDIEDIGEEIKLYIDGELVDSATSGGPLAPNLRNVNIGRSWSNSDTRFYNGLIDELRISDVARSPHSFLVSENDSPPGDYNGDGVVDADDYVDSGPIFGLGLPTDGDMNGIVDAGDYEVWKAHFGQSVGSGENALGHMNADANVPEPSTCILLALALFPFSRWAMLCRP